MSSFLRKRFNSPIMEGLYGRHLGKREEKGRGGVVVLIGKFPFKSLALAAAPDGASREERKAFHIPKNETEGLRRAPGEKEGAQRRGRGRKLTYREEVNRCIRGNISRNPLPGNERKKEGPCFPSEREGSELNVAMSV